MAITEVDEKLLVRAYQAGDERAFDTIVRTQWKALFAHALRRLNDPEGAEDAVQDTLLRAYRALPNLGGDLALKAWLHRILTNVCYDEGNRRRRALALRERVEALPEEAEPDVADEAILHDTVRVMAEALNDLPETYREALVLRYVDGLSFREVAEASGITEENARVRVHRGRQMLSKVLSRIAIVLAFLIPGLRRAQGQPAVEPSSADQGVALVTQLTSHAMAAAPAMSSVASHAAMLPANKSALITGAIAAAAAVTVPVAAYTVNEVRKPPQQRPAAVAAPFPSEAEAEAAAAPATSGASSSESAGADSTVTTDQTTTSTTASTLPPSAATPFGVGAPADAGSESPTPASPPTTVAEEPAPEPEPEAEPERKITASLLTDRLEVTRAGSDYDVTGSLVLPDGRSAAIAGRLYVSDGQLKAERLVVAVDGVEHSLRFRGPLLEQFVDTDGTTTYDFTGKFSFPGGASFGLPEEGDVVKGRFRDASGASLVLDLEGPAPQSS